MENQSITFKAMKEILKTLNDEQLSSTCTVLIRSIDEFFGVASIVGSRNKELNESTPPLFFVLTGDDIHLEEDDKIVLSNQDVLKFLEEDLTDAELEDIVYIYDYNESKHIPLVGYGITEKNSDYADVIDEDNLYFTL